MSGVPQLFGAGGTNQLVDGAVIQVNLAQYVGNAFAVTIGGNRTINFTNMIPGQDLDLYVTQDGTGSRTLAVEVNGVAALKSGTPLSTAASSLDLTRVSYRADLGAGLFYGVAKAFA